MFRSFTDRVFGGVCGGLAAVFPLNAWWFRVSFIVMSIVSLGAFAALYLLLWWIVPQESLALRRQGASGRLLLVIILTVLTVAGWIASMNGLLLAPGGADLYGPILALVLGVVFFLRQVRA
jgi:phage shock protein PspC (stress-responsive transcriptional regulator)